MIIRASSKFKKSYRKLPKNIKQKAKEKEQIFRVNPFNPKLDTHKLHGKYQEYWAFTATGQYRIMFAFIDSDNIDLLI